MIKGSRKKSVTRVTISTTYERDPYVVEYTKRRTKGICEFCGNPADLCPNCHRRMHIVDSNEDREKLISNIKL